MIVTEFLRTRNLFLAVIILTILLLAFAGFAFESDKDTEPQKTMTAHRIIDAPRLDGILDDDVWNGVEFVSGFLQKDPNEGEPAINKTEVGILYNDNSLYIGARMYFDKPEEIHDFVTRRDNAGNAERLIVSLDTYYDRRTAYSFAVTAGGVRVDYFHPSDREFHREFTFNPVWDAEASIQPFGWSAEMKIPFSQLRFSKNEKQVWGININRWIPNTNEDLYWVLIPKEETGWASRFGDLVGIEGIRPSRRIELLPYETSSAIFTGDIANDDPFNDGSTINSRVGLDLKMGLGPNLTLDATFNPDFGQVEADPAVVNLTAFETFFREKRPFFIEGNQLLDNIGPSFFYSRRIGVRPHGDAVGDFVDIPDNTTILAAAKISGRLSSGLSIGAITAVTEREYAETFIAATDSTPVVKGNTEVEPLSGFGAFRLQQEFGPSASTVGLMFTGVRRDLSSNNALRESLNRRAYSGNADWNVRFENGKYELSGYVGFSHIQGDSLAIVGAQRSSARYFQRPDASHVTLDSSRTSLTGYAASIRFNKRGGEHWLWGGGISAESPSFEINDLGILFSTDGIGSWANLSYRETKPGKIFRDYSFDFSTFNEWTFGGVRTFSILDFFFNFTLKNFWQASLHYHITPSSQSHSLTRGGPLMGVPTRHHVMARLSNNRASSFNWRARVSYLWDELDGFDFSTSARFSVKPTDALELSLEPEYERKRNPQQYFDELDGGRSETFGRRYVFSFIDRSTLSTQIRLNYAITPDLSLEFYAEPFAASGRRFNFGELLAPGSQQLLFYGQQGTTLRQLEDGSLEVVDGNQTIFLENSDFNFRSFRSNFVLRWEWRRGSTLFLVWQQDRSSDETDGRLVTFGSLFDSLKADGDNFFALKVSYWLPVN